MSPTKLSPGIIKLFPARKSLVSDIPAVDRKIYNIFLQCILTVDVELKNLADGGGDAVLGHAHVRAHLAPRDAVQEQHVTPHLHTSNIFIYLFYLI